MTNPTEDCTQSQTQHFPESQLASQATVVTEVTRHPWGRVFVQKMRAPRQLEASTTQCYLNEYRNDGNGAFHDLFDEEWSVGREGAHSSCLSFTITKCEMPQGELLKLSKVHFVIRRDLRHPFNPPILEDRSTNGTFLEASRVGKGQSRVLRNGDFISVLTPKFYLFRFYDLNINFTVADLPPEIGQHYYVGHKLGAGGCGEVIKVFHVRSCTPYAMKIVKKCQFSEAPGRASSQRVLNEIEIMKRLKHPCVIVMHEIINRPEAVFMFLELMNGGDLCQRITTHPRKRLPENLARLYFLQTCYAVRYLHAQNITHRDLKPENILLATDDDVTLVKVTDFGLSKFVQKDSIMKTMCGTPQYVAPEVLNSDAGAYTEKVDIWSLGVLLYTAVCGDFPFVLRNGRRLMTSSSCFRTLSKDVQVLIFDCLRAAVEKRPSIEDVLKYKWMTDERTRLAAAQLMDNGSPPRQNRRSGDSAQPPRVQSSVTATTPVYELSDEQFMEPPAKRIRVDYN
ncbi:ovarian-specific serine/threonine-protein kinase Lok-like [Phlebotomus argentipes]|uniref:ovarian-specific serine/threonine-protein kinase Lok-like n=1 Tax=Phlebotomus argentipes TaxID=94469 RepID=UPI0028936CE2|nr:ovarian-specific serine/threonine-protein kinase Lok-like [Phlebotomus argentipes]